MSYSDEQIKFISGLRKEGQYWDEIAEAFNDEFDTKKSGNAIKKTLTRFEATMESDLISEDTMVKNLKSTYTARVNASKARKENKALIQTQLSYEEFLSQFSEIIKSNKMKPVKVPKPAKKKGRTKMVVEPMLSDIHYGLKTETYNTDVARRRVSYYCDTTIKEIQRKEQLYNITKIHLPLMGDFMQGAQMRLSTSRSCELSDAEQLSVAIESLFYDFILPVAKLGYPMEITGLCGNHDRTASDQHTDNPGSTYFTYTLYKALEMLCIQSGLKNVKFTIPNSVYAVVEILGKNFLYEHGHAVKGGKVDILERHLIKRQAQVETILSGVRIGHYHNDLVSSMGRHIINASSVSDDHYGDILGYKSRPAQVLNFYVDCKRDTSFFHAVTVDLSEIK